MAFKLMTNLVLCIINLKSQMAMKTIVNWPLGFLGLNHQMASKPRLICTMHHRSAALEGFVIIYYFDHMHYTYKASNGFENNDQLALERHWSKAVKGCQNNNWLAAKQYNFKALEHFENKDSLAPGNHKFKVADGVKAMINLPICILGLKFQKALKTITNL